ncbi:MAG: hypothetical protein ACKVRN_03760 [Pyrinomonadaceae bacterium]
MIFNRVRTKFLSLFVVAFLCLNAGGMLCLGYCAMPAAEVVYCPLTKQPIDHCKRSGKSDTTSENLSFKANSVTCCIMPVSIFAAPLEKKSEILSELAPVAEVVDEIVFTPVALIGSRQVPKFQYRPPPNDLRFERVRNQVFRI